MSQNKDKKFQEMLKPRHSKAKSRASAVQCYEMLYYTMLYLTILYYATQTFHLTKRIPPYQQGGIGAAIAARMNARCLAFTEDPIPHVNYRMSF